MGNWKRAITDIWGLRISRRVKLSLESNLEINQIKWGINQQRFGYPPRKSNQIDINNHLEHETGRENIFKRIFLLVDKTGLNRA